VRELEATTAQESGATTVLASAVGLATELEATTEQVKAIGSVRESEETTAQESGATTVLASAVGSVMEPGVTTA
jgi:hypothetical protein